MTLFKRAEIMVGKVSKFYQRLFEKENKGKPIHWEILEIYFQEQLSEHTKQLETENAELKKVIKYKMDDYKLHIEGLYVEKYADKNKKLNLELDDIKNGEGYSKEIEKIKFKNADLKAKLLSRESELTDKDLYIARLKKEIAKYYNEKI